ncbi:MAG TPA: DNA polymerase III subunit delta [Vicinamibacteria bacterium]
MKPSKLTYSQLDKHLATGPLAAAYILNGDQDLLRELASGKIRQAALGDSANDFNLERFDGEKSTPDSLVMAANTLPLWGLTGGRRVLIVKRAKRLVEGAEAEPLIGYLKNPSPQTVLVMELEASPDGRRKAWKEIANNATIVQCDPLKDWQMEEWIAEQASNLGVTLGREEVRYLAGEFGSDLRRQLGELEKISLYAGREELGVEELGALLGRGKAQSIFRFTDAFASRQTSVALKQLGRLLEEGEPALRILALLDRVLGQLLVAKELGRRGGRTRELTQVLRIPPPAAENIARWSDAFDEDDLLEAVRGLARCDRQLKTGGMPASLILEGFVLSVCGVGEPAGRFSSRR